MRRLSVVLLLGLAAALCPAATSAADAASAAMQATGSLQADFDNDGATDLAIGVLLEDIGGVLDAGAVNVLYGTGGGLSGTGNQVFWQGSPGVVGTPEVDDEFGTALVGSDQPTGATTAATAARHPDDVVQP